MFILHLPHTGLFTEFYFTNQRWLCGVVYPIGAYFIRVSYIGQNFLAINRFTAMFFPMKHEKVDLKNFYFFDILRSGRKETLLLSSGFV
jgi:hypothetical protein